jgi:DNA uptake protein ComE-like DNA-binding protein
MLCLRLAPRGAENGAMRIWPITIALSAGILCTGLAVAPQTAPKAPPIPPLEARVDINHASLEDLLKVSGMTRTWAGRIIRFRPYRTKQDLLDRGVVSGEVYDRIKEYIIAHRQPQ